MSRILTQTNTMHPTYEKEREKKIVNQLRLTKGKVGKSAGLDGTQVKVFKKGKRSYG